MKLSLKEKLRKYIDKHKMLPQLKSIQVNRDERETNTLAIKNAIRSALYQNIKQVHNLSNQELWQKINIESRVIMLQYNITLADQRRIIQEIFDKIRGYDLLQPLISNPLITEIMVNRYDRIFYEQGGKIFHSQIKFENEQAYRELINHWFAKANRPLNHSYPIADLRLPDGSRAHAVIPPASPDGPILNIRKFSNVKPDRNFYISRKGIPEKYMEFLENAVRDKKSIFICGGTGSGKTTLLNILSASIPTMNG